MTCHLHPPLVCRALWTCRGGYRQQAAVHPKVCEGVGEGGWGGSEVRLMRHQSAISDNRHKGAIDVIHTCTPQRDCFAEGDAADGMVGKQGMSTNPSHLSPYRCAYLHMYTCTYVCMHTCVHNDTCPSPCTYMVCTGGSPTHM